MAKGKQTRLALAIFSRIALFVVVIGLGALTSTPAYTFISETFNFINPFDFFGASWADWGLAWVLASLFWGGVVFGTLGKKLDYFFISLLIVIGLLGFFYTKNVTPDMYLGLIAVAVLGNILGYMLKVGRKNWFGK